MKKLFQKSAYLYFILAMLMAMFNFNISSTKAQFSQNCDPSFLAKLNGGQSGTTDLIVKPADAKNVVLELKFNQGAFSSIQSDCQGQGAYLESWDTSKKYLVTMNKDAIYPGATPAKEGVYNIDLIFSYPGDFAKEHQYYQKEVTIRVAKDPLNPPTGGGNTNSNTSNNTNTNTGPQNNSTPNNLINTNTSANFNVNLDENLGTFDNALKVNSLPELIATLIKILFFLVGLAAVIVIIIAGFQMVLAQGNESKLTNAKKAITWAVVGLIVSVLAFSIVAIIQSIIQTRL